ncbi:DUF397 domain-containing protein [Streptomyces luteireticuli]|uniref:DUF397 domain-containing protein n=1 Tax=Streptomyces luteireticuli TaxID=173858 RepID=UPI003556771D
MPDTHVTPSTHLAPDADWTTSSHSGGGNACVQSVHLVHRVGIRDSKTTSGPALLVEPGAWCSFVSALQGGDLG